MKKRHSLDEAARQCGIEEELIVRFVSYEWIVPVDWNNRFLDEEDIARARLICELLDNFGVNEASIPVILHLVDQLNQIRNGLDETGP